MTGKEDFLNILWLITLKIVKEAVFNHSGKWNSLLEYSDGQKSCTFFPEFLWPPPGGGGLIFELVDYVKWSSPNV